METILHCYRFDVSKPDEAAAWRALNDKLKGWPHCMSAMESDNGKHHRKHILPLDGQPVTLETKHLFNNQWNTTPTATSENGLRVFDWRLHYQLHNQDIKEGHYLEQTDEMKETRRNTVKCGYCAHQYQAAQGYVFCTACLDSEYLKENDLRLLRLLPVSQDDHKSKREPLTDAERAHLMPQYVERQTTGADSRNVKKLRKQRERIADEYESTTREALTKRDGLLWLMDHGVSIDNVIYYSHTDMFCFGWRGDGLARSVISALLDLLTEFPYEYEIKEAGVEAAHV